MTMSRGPGAGVGWTALFVAVLMCGRAHGQVGGPGASTLDQAPKLPAEELDKLLAPIALYPDVLIAQILPASTFPLDIVKAARWLGSSPDISELAEQEWDSSVLALCHYPSVVQKLDKDLDWTNALGVAFLAQQEDVMEAIQRLRRQAGIIGALQSNEKQTIVFEQETIRIVPTQRDVVYIPSYNSQVVYVVDNRSSDSVSVGTAVAASAVSFGAGLALGTWLNTDCDWRYGNVYHCRPGYWGGWGYRGAVRFNDDWVAARGRYRGIVAGDGRGAYVGPRGAAVWGDNGRGAVWRRPAAAYGAPRYTGRYVGYNRYGGNFGGVNRGSVIAGNQVNINRSNRNIDRGDRTRVGGGDRTNVRRDARSRDRTQGVGSRTGRPNRSGSAFGGSYNRTNAGRYSQRGYDSRRSAGRSSGSGSLRGGTGRTSGSRYQGSTGRGSQYSGRGSSGSSSRSRGVSGSASRSTSRRSSFGDSRSSRQINEHSSRGRSSRGSFGGGRGGGRRGGGGRRR